MLFFILFEAVFCFKIHGCVYKSFFIVKAKKFRYLCNSKMMNTQNKTIFAPATLVGESGITVTRISGHEAFAVISKLFSVNSDRFKAADFYSENSHTIHHGYIFDKNELIDEVVVSVFKSPNSFTGEDVIELSTHGGNFIFRKISNLLQRYGCSLADPGDFSKRAYLNGKIDLAQAEAIADLIKAKTESANKLALRQLSGEFSNKIKLLREEMINYCSLLELELDFSEEGLDLVSRETLLSKIDNIINNITKITQSYESGKIIKNGVNLAIIGAPNVGKSSIFNYLLDENRAIVSDIPGTTRDYLQEPLIMNGIKFNLIDTAGMRETKDIIESEGVKRSKLKMEESDIILEVEDLSNNLNGNVSLNLGNLNKVIKVYNKLDLSAKQQNGKLAVSTKTGQNMNLLQEEIVSKAKNLISNDELSDIIITNERHRDCLLKSCEYLVNAKGLILQGGGNELISFEIRASMDAVTEIIGKTGNVDILNNIFTKFCIGK